MQRTPMPHRTEARDEPSDSTLRMPNRTEARGKLSDAARPDATSDKTAHPASMAVKIILRALETVGLVKRTIKW